ncbi:MAG: NADH-quinone oxidoreductase subunit NuoG [Gammaproteobacteria bacterium]
MSEERVQFTVDGQTLEAPKGEMLIRATDEAGIYIPRFCYHKHLQVVANCRMCLVEVEGSPKPLPACATPISDGMVAHTHSERAVDAQRAAMEFLLINHPLDCPVCDQGGECELQDLSLGYGRGVSRFTERKRVVEDKSIGPLVHTAMTRCIHCTRCIRVLEEIGGRQEMGATNRGEHLKIGTWIERSIDSELSGNIIDVCPVGALNDKPFNMRARGWEVLAHKTVSPNDCVGSHMYGHSLRGVFLRAVPRDNEAVNACWIPDRDRWCHTGLNAAERLRRPLLRRDGKLEEASWEEALAAAAKSLDAAGAELATLVSPSASLEEMYLAQKLSHALGSPNIDARLRQADFRDDAGDPRFPALGGPIADLDHTDAVLLVGSRINKEAPILAWRLRRTAANGGAVMALNPRRYDLVLPLVEDRLVHPDELVPALAALARVLANRADAKVPAFLGAFDAPAEDLNLDAIAKRLFEAERPRILLGRLAGQHPAWADIRRLAVLIAELAEGGLGSLTDGANMAGAYLAGAVPHRGPGGVVLEEPGLDAQAMLAEPQAGYLLLDIEPEHDSWQGGAALAVLRDAPVVALSSFVSPAMREYADCVLPLAAFGETAGSSINGEGRLQRFDAVSVPVGESRPAWKIFRALGAALGFETAFDFANLAEVRDEAVNTIGYTEAGATQSAYAGDWEPKPAAEKAPEGSGLRAVGEVGINALNPLLRRAAPLQETTDARDSAKLWLHPADAAKIGLDAGGRARVSGAAGGGEFEVATDPGVARGSLWVPGTRGLALFDTVEVEAVAQAAEA